MTPTSTERRSGVDRRANPRYSMTPNADPYFCDKCGEEFEFLSQLLAHRNDCKVKKSC